MKTVLEHSNSPAFNSKEMVETILTVLEAYHTRQMEKLQEIRSGFNEFFPGKLEAAWERLLINNNDQTEAIKVLTCHIMAELDGGDGPIIQ